jgi:undecaprenyl diphosphate synthase
MHNRTLFLTIAICYSGRLDIVRAVKELSHQVRLGILRPEDITEDMISAHLSLTHLSLHRQQPDIVIRTSGEQRLSNFLLWESAYSELYFTDVLWPDFDDDTLEAALLDYSTRTRRYGKGH